MLFDVENGQLLAILPDGYIQKMRVAMTHALATEYMARENAQTLGLFGSGWQASAQAVVQCKVRGISGAVNYFDTLPLRKRARVRRNCGA